MPTMTPTLAAGWRRAAPAGLATMLALAGTLLAACQTQALPVASTPSGALSAANDDKLAAALLARIRAEIGLAHCDSTAQCRTVAIGEKACGGPESWLAWSTKQSDAARLTALSAESAALARQRNTESGMASNCRYNADPGSQCVAGVCRLINLNLAN